MGMINTGGYLLQYDEKSEIEIKHIKGEKLKKLLNESMEENIELLKELPKY